MDRERLADLLAACSAAPARSTRRSTGCAPCRSRTSASRGSTTTASLRNGFPEVVFGQGKTPEQIVAIAERLAAAGGNVLVTRLAPGRGRAAGGRGATGFEYHAAAAARGPARARPRRRAARARCWSCRPAPPTCRSPRRRRITAEMMGNPVERLYDVGVSGLHRLLGERERSGGRRGADRRRRHGRRAAERRRRAGRRPGHRRARRASATAPASAASRRCSAMLNTCAAGVVVVNIDNGFGAAAAATRMQPASSVMADITAGRARRMLSVGRPHHLGGRQLPLAGDQAAVPVDVARRRRRCSRRTSATPRGSSSARRSCAARSRSWRRCSACGTTSSRRGARGARGRCSRRCRRCPGTRCAQVIDRGAGRAARGALRALRARGVRGGVARTGAPRGAARTASRWWSRCSIPASPTPCTRT